MVTTRWVTIFGEWSTRIITDCLKSTQNEAELLFFLILLPEPKLFYQCPRCVGFWTNRITFLIRMR